MKKIISIILLMVTLLTGCSSNKSEKTANYDIIYNPQNLDPQTTVDTPSLTVISNIMEGLFTVASDGKIKEGLAKEYSVSEDGLKYNFILRNDVKWENGDVVTANDFVFAFKRLFNSDTNSPYADKLYCIKNAKDAHNNKQKEIGVTAKSNTELVIELEYKSLKFLSFLTMPMTFPCNEKYFYSTKGKYGLLKTTIISNGRYKISKWDEEKYVKLVKNNEHYSARDNAVDSVLLWIDKDHNVQERFDKGDTNLAFIEKDIDKYSPKKYNIEKIENSITGIGFNTANSYFKNENIRKAIALAFSYTSYSSNLLENHSLALGLVPQGIKLYDKSYRELIGNTITPTNLENAKKLYKQGLLELGVKELKKITILVPEDSDCLEYFNKASQYLQQDLGIFIGVEKAEKKIYDMKLKSSDFDCAIVEFTANNIDENSILNIFSTTNIFSYSNNELNIKLDMAKKADNIDESITFLKEAEKIILDSGIFLPIVAKTNYFIWDNNLKDVSYNRQLGICLF